MSVLLEMTDVHKSYAVGRNVLDILKGVCVSVRSGESLAVVGVSGAGKSTLMHIMGGLDRPDSGNVLINGRDFYSMSQRMRTSARATQIGFVFQSYHLLPEMDVLENVMLPSMALGGAWSARRQARSRAMDLLDSVGLCERAGHTPMELSGGEQQRVALVRALMNQPQLVLADEPTGNLDDGTGNNVLQNLLSLSRIRGGALVVVTHNEHVAEACDRRMRLVDGVLRE